MYGKVHRVGVGADSWSMKIVLSVRLEGWRRFWSDKQRWVSGWWWVMLLKTHAHATRRRRPLACGTRVVLSSGREDVSALDESPVTSPSPACTCTCSTEYGHRSYVFQLTNYLLSQDIDPGSAKLILVGFSEQHVRSICYADFNWRSTQKVLFMVIH